MGFSKQKVLLHLLCFFFSCLPVEAGVCRYLSSATPWQPHSSGFDLSFHRPDFIILFPSDGRASASCPLLPYSFLTFLTPYLKQTPAKPAESCSVSSFTKCFGKSFQKSHPGSHTSPARARWAGWFQLEEARQAFCTHSPQLLVNNRLNSLHIKIFKLHGPRNTQARNIE